MSLEQIENNYTTTLNGAIDNSTTSITVSGAPSTLTGQFRIKIDNEIILVGTASGTSFTNCTRGAEGTTAASHSNGASVKHILSTGSLRAVTSMAPALDRWHTYPFSSTNSASITITAANSGQRLILAVATRGNDVTSVSCTNVTWTEVQGINQSTSTYLSIYVGVATGTTGTTITVNVGGTNFVFAQVAIVNDQLTPTTVNSASLTAASVSTIRKTVLGPVTCEVGDFFIMAYATNDASNAVSEMWCSSPFFWIPDDSLCGLHVIIGRAMNTSISGWFDGGNSAVAVGLVAVR